MRKRTHDICLVFAYNLQAGGPQSQATDFGFRSPLSAGGLMAYRLGTCSLGAYGLWAYNLRACSPGLPIAHCRSRCPRVRLGAWGIQSWVEYNLGIPILDRGECGGLLLDSGTIIMGL